VFKPDPKRSFELTAHQRFWKSKSSLMTLSTFQKRIPDLRNFRLTQVLKSKKSKKKLK
jgi:hypothetical protein